MTQLVDIILPEGQLEGTSASLSMWLVKKGDSVNEGDPIAELETDKVTMEVCATASGIVDSLIAQPGDEVAPEQLLGKIAKGAAATNAIETAERAQPTAAAEHSASTDTLSVVNDDKTARDFLSPAVRRLLRENNLSIEPIPGTGKHGRVTRDDVLNYLKNPTPIKTIEPAVEAEQPTENAPARALSSTTPFSVNDARESRPLKGEMVPHTNMRKSIAAHMVESLLETSPHVTSVFEMDMGNIIEHRKWHKKEYEALGVKLTFTAYFLAAIVKGVQAVPQVNARFHEEALEIFKDVNIGVGTALGDAGLVVPVVEQVQTMNLFEIAKALNAQTVKARDGKLTPADMKNGSITISNHGVSGSLFATPIIINQPQVAIVGIGKLEKRVVVEEVNGVDTMVIRPKCYVSLSIDHRALDAHQTNNFLSVFVETIENWGQ
ncbi:2-oxo acid dehydrogenase subunit E2 [Aliikangiella marina]|uniref:Dihydrolipoamide acetyltransferase component of pyruvate dehydrogenase complex n=1 Tax=Aliikangiella marina TaxID=1712262 RepID=A0A545T2V9_9GAMM|nr:dihydrolipoamide acetyltransferase family protein [Aliikangiella marina]TQV71515.1 2-oxo acid dehydrogenase subunit E2 [Aliikangiella marina]